MNGPLIVDCVIFVISIGLIALGLFAPMQPNMARYARVSTCWLGSNIALGSGAAILPSKVAVFSLSDSVAYTFFWALLGIGTMSALAALFYILSFTPAIAAAMHVPPRLYEWLYGRRMTDDL